MSWPDLVVEVVTSCSHASMLQAFKARESDEDHLVNAKNNALCQSTSEVYCTEFC